MEDIGAGVHFGDGGLLRGAVPGLYDAAEGAVRLPQDPAIAAPLVQAGGEHGADVAVLQVGVHQGAEGLLPHHGRVAAADDEVSVKTLKQGGGILHGPAGAVEGLLHSVGVLGEGLQHLLLLPAHHKNDILRGEEGQAPQHIVEQGVAVRLAHDLGQVDALGLKTGALPSGQHQGLYIMIHVKVSFFFKPESPRRFAALPPLTRGADDAAF